jgi:hypothetical protein
VATPTIREVVHTATSGVAATVTTGAGTAVDDILICFSASDYYNASDMVAPTGTAGTWTQVATTADLGSLNSHLKVWWRKVTVGGAQTVTVSPHPDEDLWNTTYVLTGADTTNPIDDAVSAATDPGASANHVCPAVSPSTADALCLTGLYTQVFSLTNYTAPAGFTKQNEDDNSSTGASASKVLSSSGSTGTLTWTADIINCKFVTCTVAVKGAGAAAPVTNVAGPLGPGPGRISPSGIWTLQPGNLEAREGFADTTTGTGTAFDASVVVSVNADTTTGAGTAFDASPDTQVNADTTTGAGAAFDAYLSGVDNTAGPYTGPAPGRISPSGVWWLQPGDPSATGGGGTLASSAETTTGTGTAYDATVDFGVNADTTTGTGVANNGSTDTTANAGTTTATGVATDTAISLSVNAETITATGTALDAQAAASVNAETTTGTGVSNAATVDLGVNAENASGTGAANDATITATGANVSASAECATATGTAYDATVTVVSTPTTGSWYQLISILREQFGSGRSQVDDPWDIHLNDPDYRSRSSLPSQRPSPPLACPNDGEPLRPEPDGRLRCPFDGWIYGQDPS